MVEVAITKSDSSNMDPKKLEILNKLCMIAEKLGASEETLKSLKMDVMGGDNSAEEGDMSGDTPSPMDQKKMDMKKMMNRPATDISSMMKGINY